MKSMAQLTGRVPGAPADVSPATVEAEPAPARADARTPAPAPRHARAPVRAELDSLLNTLIEEAPAPAPRRASVSSATPQAAPAAAPPIAPRRRVPWRAIGFGVLSTAALVAVAFAPRLGALVAAPARQPDGVPMPTATGVDRWLAANNGGNGYLI